MKHLNQHIKLADGRVLGFARIGTPGGKPVFYFTGGNSSRVEGLWFEKAARKQGIDLIVPDRPGFGLSDFQPDRRFIDWPDDVAQLANSLGVQEFAVFGLSGGSPHTAAAVFKMPQRIRRAAIVSGVAPPEMPEATKGMWPPVRLIFFSARRFPALNRLLLRQMSAFYADEVQMLRRMRQVLPSPDVELINARPEIIRIFSQAAGEAHRQGVMGDHYEWTMYVRPWGFQLEDIRTEIGLWYGEVDGNVPSAMGEYMHSRLPNSRLSIVPDGGHFSTINNHVSEIFAYLTAV